MSSGRLEPAAPARRIKREVKPDPTTLGQMAIGRGPSNKPGRPADEGRRLALISLFEAEFGLRTAPAALDRHRLELAPAATSLDLARSIIRAVAADRARIDARLGNLAPRHPVTTMGRIDRVLLRAALAERAMPGSNPKAVDAAWAAIARAYGGDASRRLMSGVLGALTPSAR